MTCYRRIPFLMPILCVGVLYSSKECKLLVSLVALFVSLAFFGLGAASPSASESESELTVGKPLKICSVTVAFPHQ